MKNYYWLLLAIFFIASCGDDDDTVVDPDPTPDPVNYVESSDGELSGDHSNPSGPLLLEVGNNILEASQSGGDNRDVDYVTIEVQEGQLWTGLILNSLSENNAGFIGLIAGNSFPNDENNTIASDLLGGLVYGSDLQGQNILNELSMLSDAAGFNLPLSSGTYSIWLNQTSGSTTSNFTFVITEEKM